MPITVIVRATATTEASLTFDGMQRIVIGRGSGSDVRLPDPSVSHRHATLSGQGADFVLTDEGSTNGTFVGSVRVAPHTSRIVRSGDRVRVGRYLLEISVGPGMVTRDVAIATRDMALALVSEAMRETGTDLTAQIRVLEGVDQGALLKLFDDDRVYTIGRAPHCDLLLGDADASREHAQVVSRRGTVVVQDLGTKNGTWLGGVRVPEGQSSAWRPTQMVQIGRSVLALEEPVREALARLEIAPDEPFAAQPEDPERAGENVEPSAADGRAGSSGADMATRDSVSSRPAGSSHGVSVSAMDVIVMAAAFGVLTLSLVGLVWILRR